MNPSNILENKKVRKNSTFDRLNKWMDRWQISNYSFINTTEKRFDSISHFDVEPRRLMEAAWTYSKVIALGNFASESLERAGIRHFKMPHPSPRNRSLNDINYEWEQIKKCGKYLGVW
jgi:hypothetical protein